MPFTLISPDLIDDIIEASGKVTYIFLCFLVLANIQASSSRKLVSVVPLSKMATLFFARFFVSFAPFEIFVYLLGVRIGQIVFLIKLHLILLTNLLPLTPTHHGFGFTNARRATPAGSVNRNNLLHREPG